MFCHQVHRCAQLLLEEAKSNISGLTPFLPPPPAPPPSQLLNVDRDFNDIGMACFVIKSIALLNVDRDFNDIGMACFVIKSIAVRNCLPQAKSRLVLSAWNPPPNWSRHAMIRVVGKIGKPVDGVSPIETFEVR
ncbi:unnamed protein product [Closterium sp. Yama58-4]|nr:unnamed protein product [Closterium sp. Yama58-4]